MEDVLLPKSFSCSTPSSEDPDDDRPPPAPDSVVVEVAPPPPPKCKSKCNARLAASALMFAAVIMCISIILWYVFTHN